jgi:SAM-dependent methyltransferase
LNNGNSELGALASKFIPEELEWLTSHYSDVPQQTLDFCGDISGATVLNLGCGEMLTDFGLLNLNVREIVGLDLHEKSSAHLHIVAQKLRDHGIAVPQDYEDRLSYRHYDGVRFPFEDSRFDFVFSWSAFEHVNQVETVLSEIRRVLRDDGRAFIQVYPWYHCPAGSHLGDFIQEPYFHLKRQNDWVRLQVENYAEAHPERRDFLVNHLLREYLTLNRLSADRFYEHVVRAGFQVAKAQIISFDLDLSTAPEHIAFSELMICGTKMLLKKRIFPDSKSCATDSTDRAGLTLLLQNRDEEIEKLRAELNRVSTCTKDLTRMVKDREDSINKICESLSWRITTPLRTLGSAFLRVFYWSTGS